MEVGLRVTWVGDNKGAGPWDFVKQSDKLHYNEGNLISDYDDPIWATDHLSLFDEPITPTHHPHCGYWHKAYVPGEKSGPGTLWTAGRNNRGQLGLGLGGAEHKNVFTQVGVDFWLKVACGSEHTLAIKEDGTLWAAGYNNKGQLGLGDTTNRTTFEQVGSDLWKEVFCGYRHTFAIRDNGTLWSAGWNVYGQLGLGDEGAGTDRYAFEQVGSNLWISGSGGNYHSFAVKEDGTLWSTGSNTYGQLGLGYWGGTVNSFTQITSPALLWRQVSCKAYDSFAVSTGNVVYAAGYNNYGKLGLGDNTSRNTLTQVTSLPAFSEDGVISCGLEHSSAVQGNGELLSTGRDVLGQAGFGGAGDKDVFTQVGTEYKKVACGENHTLAIKEVGMIFSTGYNFYGQLALGDNSNKDVFTNVYSDLWQLVSCGYQHSAAIREPA